MGNNRIFVRDTVISSAVAITVEKLKDRLKKHGVYSFMGPHEILGVVTEEYQELITATHQNLRHEVKAELVDIAVACIFGLASLNQQDIDGEKVEENSNDPNNPENPSIKMMIEEIERGYANLFNQTKAKQ